MAISEEKRRALAESLRELADGNGEAIFDRAKRLRVDELGD